MAGRQVGLFHSFGSMQLQTLTSALSEGNPSKFCYKSEKSITFFIVNFYILTTNC